MTRPKSVERIPPKVKRSITFSLQQDLIQVTETTWRFKANCSDQRIADLHKVSLWSVQNLRRNLFGSLDIEDYGSRSTTSPLAHAFHKIDKLQEEISFIKLELDELREAQQRLKNIASIVDCTPSRD